MGNLVAFSPFFIFIYFLQNPRTQQGDEESRDVSASSSDNLLSLFKHQFLFLSAGISLTQLDFTFSPLMQPFDAMMLHNLGFSPTDS